MPISAMLARRQWPSKGMQLDVALCRQVSGLTGTPSTAASDTVTPVTTKSEGSQYAIHEILGSGSMSIIRRCVHRESGQVYAMKLLRRHDDELLEVAASEYKILKDSKHPSIIRVHSFIDSNSTVALVMDLCQGSVQSRVDSSGPFEVRSAQRLLAQLFEGVAFLHRRRIVHCDVKPSNLLLLQEGADLNLKIADFNSAKKIGGGQQSGMRTCLLDHNGTALYSAPEILFGWFWNERVDIWAAGLCACLVLQGGLPFDQANPSVRDTLERAMALPAGSLDNLPSSVAAGFVQQCLVVSMQDRPTAMELLRHPFINSAAVRVNSAEEDSPRSSQDQPHCAAGASSVLLPQCGLLFSSVPAVSDVRQSSAPKVPTVKTMHDLMTAGQDGLSGCKFWGSTSVPTAPMQRRSSFMESRDGSTALAELTSRKFEDSSREGSFRREDPSESYDLLEDSDDDFPEVEWRRCFTTHGAVSEPLQSVNTSQC